MNFKKLFQLLVVGGSVAGTAACEQAPKNPDPNSSGTPGGGGGTVAQNPNPDGGTAGGEGGGGGGVKGW